MNIKNTTAKSWERVQLNWTNEEYRISSNHITWYSKDSTEKLKKRINLIKLQEAIFHCKVAKREQRRFNLVKNLKSLGYKNLSNFQDVLDNTYSKEDKKAIKLLNQLQDLDYYDFDYEDYCYTIGDAHWERIDMEKELELRRVLSQGVDFDEAVRLVRMMKKSA